MFGEMRRSSKDETDVSISMISPNAWRGRKRCHAYIIPLSTPLSEAPQPPEIELASP